MSETTSKLYDQAAEFTKMWCDMVSKLATAGLAFTPESTPTEAARQIRDAAFKNAEKTLAEYMRSPQFLEGMKKSMETTMAARAKFNELLTRAHHELQIPAKQDIDVIIETIRGVEEKTARRLDALASRLDEISGRLDALDGQGKAASRGKSAKPKPQRKSKTGASPGSKRKTRR